MTHYAVDVTVRWSDQDAYGHVNHAVVVTLLEDARTALLFDEATQHGVAAFEAGLLVGALEVRYRRPIPWSRHGVRVQMWVHELRAASFRVGYRLLLGDDTGKPAVEASTQLVPYDLATTRPRRLSPEEKAFLQRYLAEPAAT